MELLHECPKTNSFISIAEHQSSTPSSFYTGPPVLHYHSEQCKILIPARDLTSSPALSSLDHREVEPASATNGSIANGDSHQSEVSEGSEAKKVIDQVEVWVTSEYVILRRQVLYLVTDRKQHTALLFESSWGGGFDTIPIDIAARNRVSTFTFACWRA